MTETQSVPGAPVRVLHVVKGLGPGGAERLVLNHMLERDRTGFHYEVAYLVREKDHLVAPLRDAGVAVTRVEGGPWPLRLRETIKRGRFDIVHAHSPVLASAARTLKASRLIRAQIVSTEHNRWPRHHRVTRLANRLSYPFDDATIAVSHEVRDSIAPSLNGHVRVIHHGIPLADVRSQRSERDNVRQELGLHGLVIGIVANFRPEKAYDVFLEAVRRAGKDTSSVHWVVVGQGPGLGAFEEAVADGGLGDNVTVTGYRSDATRVMAGFDVFTLSSRHEGLPVALMEAMALGLPTVSTRAGGIPEAIEHEANGLLVDVDDAAGLADAWLRIVADPDLRVRLGQAATSTSERFDAGSSTREIESLYRRLMTGSA